MRTFLLFITKIFNILLWPLKGLPGFLSLSFIALITGFLAVLIFKHVSDQKMLKKTMNRIKLHFTEIIIYRDDIRQILHAQKEILKQNLFYFVHTIKPAIPIVAIVLIILSQMNIRYSFQFISPGEPVIVKVTRKDPVKIHNPFDIELKLPEGLEVVTPAFHIPGGREIEWRIRGEHKGRFDLEFSIRCESEAVQGDSKTHINKNAITGKTIKKNILIGASNAPFSPHLGRKGFFEILFNPLEELLPNDAPIDAIDIGYKSRSFKLGFLGLKVHWLVAFLVIAVAFGIICRKILKVS